MKKTILLCLSVASLFVSCVTEKPLSSAPPANNETYSVEYLFEFEGTKVYRFRDMGNYVYFTRPAGTVTAICADSSERVIRTIQIP